jgi:hypothetical protein
MFDIDRLLEILVWQGARLLMRRRWRRVKRKAIVGGVAAVVVVGVVAAGRQATRSGAGS